ncbi:hypothetical protein [Methanocella arvoryzae]|uniref:Uncharacterized protein n=1 Tax=Methanocella arvoryzae (strain DSM 22066 / NBRC 105507 / MRE50) TaxID=351160 RepID=Q0W3Z7_METAR|nr:hypothetical protein [Methanocella arvoryzae]CAJ36896.1 hypothetical protein RCIX1668 [Methanocella arvoryzae MRE50]
MIDDIKDLGRSGKDALDTAKKLQGMPEAKLSELKSQTLSPIEEMKRAIEAAKQKAEAPVRMLQQKQQQLKATTEAAQQKADAARKLLELKELAGQRAKKDGIGLISDQKALAIKAKNSVQDRASEVRAKGDAVMSLIQKIEAQARGEVK